jgi:hypothetical protein
VGTNKLLSNNIIKDLLPFLGTRITLSLKTIFNWKILEFARQLTILVICFTPSLR